MQLHVLTKFPSNPKVSTACFHSRGEKFNMNFLAFGGLHVLSEVLSGEGQSHSLAVPT